MRLVDLGLRQVVAHKASWSELKNFSSQQPYRVAVKIKSNNQDKSTLFVLKYYKRKITVFNKLVYYINYMNYNNKVIFKIVFSQNLSSELFSSAISRKVYLSSSFLMFLLNSLFITQLLLPRSSAI